MPPKVCISRAGRWSQEPELGIEPKHYCQAKWPFLKQACQGYFILYSRRPLNALAALAPVTQWWCDKGYILEEKWTDQPQSLPRRLAGDMVSESEVCPTQAVVAHCWHRAGQPWARTLLLWAENGRAICLCSMAKTARKDMCPSPGCEYKYSWGL